MIIDGREVTGWRLWLRKRPTLFGYAYAGLLSAMVAWEFTKRSLPFVTLLLIVGGIGYWIGVT
jgi:hypothetical protein